MLFLPPFLCFKCSHKKSEKSNTVHISIYGSQEHLVSGGTKGQRKQVMEIALRKKKIHYSHTEAKTEKIKKRDVTYLSHKY